MSDQLEIVDFEQGTPEWHAWRREKRPASISPMLMGTSKFQDAGDAYDAMLDDRPDDLGFTEKILDFGNRTEPRARDKLAQILGAQPFPVAGHRGPYSASLDGYLMLDGKRIGYEVKCPFSGVKSSTWKAATKGTIEPGYSDQIEHQCNVFDLDEAYLFVYIDDDTHLLVPYQRRPERWKEIQKAWDHFYREHLDKLVRPNPYVQRTDDDWMNAASDFVAAKEELEKAEGKLKKIRDDLVKLAGGRKAEGFGVRLNIYTSRGTIDFKAALKTAAPEFDPEPFRKAPKETTTVSLMKE